MTHLGLTIAIADQMEAEGWQERSDTERCAEAARRYEDVMSGRVPPPWAKPTKPQPAEPHIRLRADSQYEMVFEV